MAVFFVPNDLVPATLAGLNATDAAPADRRNAVALLALVAGSLEAQIYSCRLALLDLGEQLGMEKGELTRAATTLD